MKISFTIGSSVREGAIDIEFNVPTDETSTEINQHTQEEFEKSIDYALLMNKKLYKLYQAEELRRKA